MSNLQRVLRYFRPDLPRIIFALCLLVFATLANLLKPWPLAWIIDSVLADKPLPQLIRQFTQGWSKTTLLEGFALALLALHATQGAVTAWQNYVTIAIGLRGLARVRTELFNWLQRLSLRFHLNSNQGDVIYRASWDTYAFQTLFQHGLFAFLTALLSLVLMISVMWRLNPLLTGVALAVVPLLLVVMKSFGREMKSRSLAAHQTDSQVTSLFQQSITALPLIQSYTREEFEQGRFEEKARAAYQKRVSQHGCEVLYWLLISLLFAAGTAAIVWFGANQVLAGKLTVGALWIFISYLAQLYEPLNQLSHLGATVADAKAGTQRVFELLDTAEEIKDSAGARPVRGAPVFGNDVNPTTRASGPALLVQGNISFEHVSFGYSPERPVLADITFEIKAGESIALVGPSGAGKTTLLQLLPRFYDPTSGTIRLEGVDLRELKLKELRAQIGLVLQEPILLAATVAENIAYGKPEARREEIKAAASAAHADEFIERLPQGYETIIGEGAARLSAGEKQRLNLARAFLKNAPILLLDEPTSALDPKSERLVVESIGKLVRARTTLMVAHRMSTIRTADRVLVLRDGKLIEQGKSDELLARDSYFSKLRAGEL